MPNGEQSNVGWGGFSRRSLSVRLPPLPVSWPRSSPGGNKNVKKESEVEC